ncbi:riboflavin synthase [Desulfovibrio sp. OttesenSCG-928-O18]|nr:riboflavin synthase [Desulfovibrio sp. OttesenSCG-928-O18]
MFTGIIQCLGDVTARRGTQNEARFTITPRTPFPDPEIGESIAVNGTCLTAESFSGNSFTAYASGETLGVSTLAGITTGSVVNLERAVTFATRLGGHLVSGHVDCIATVSSVTAKGDSTIFRLAFPRAMGHLIVPKGSVALDGVSLTINECGTDFLTVNIIPETLGATVIQSWKPGSRVNMETDLIGKYVARMIETGYVPSAGNGNSSGLTLDFLKENGF